MCGRATLSTPPEDLSELFDAPLAEGDPLREAHPRYNVCPTEAVAVVRPKARESEPPRVLQTMRWGLVPHWAKDIGVGAKMINARVETIDQRPPFKDALGTRRCIVLVDGFYEWRRDGTKKTPFYFKRRDGHPMALAGLWDTWKAPDGRHVTSCTIVTLPSAPPVQDLHDRMPLILELGANSAANVPDWLDVVHAPELRLDAICEAARSSAVLVGYPVDPRVNSPKNDGPENTVPVVPEEIQRSLF